MKGLIGLVRCTCGRNISVEEYELMFVHSGDAGYNQDESVTIVTCPDCGKKFAMKLTFQIARILDPELEQDNE